ncbi:MAG: DegV family protein, partial [Oscillospiraceae bacterium]
EELINKNLSFEEITEKLNVYIREITLVFSLSSYDNLVKNGRLKPIVGMIASKLKIRTIAVASKEGTIDMIKKLHGAQKTYSAMIEIMCARKNLSGLPVVIHHCLCNESVEELKVLLAKQGCTDVTVFECRGITTYYAMPGGIIISY